MPEGETDMPCSATAHTILDTTADLALATDIAAAFLGQAVYQITPIRDKGLVNQIFTVQTAETAVVVRMSKPEDEDRGLLFYEKEAWCLEQAAALGIPGPKVLAIGRMGTRPYMLQTLVTGVNGEDSPVDAKHIWYMLGQYARLIHTITLDGFGETLADFHAGNAQDHWQTWLDYNLDSLAPTDPLLRLAVYSTDQVAEIRHIFQALRATTFRIGLNHNDLTARNTIVDETGQVNLLDWGSAEAHLVPHYDLLEILRWQHPNDERFRAFLLGYQLDQAELATLLREIRSLALLKAFDLTRWAIDRCPARIDEIAAQARKLVRQQVAAA